MKKILISILLMTFFVGCSTAPIKEGRSEGEDLKEAVTKYWTYRVQNDLGNAYYYENVSYTKKSTREFYMRGFGGSKVDIKGFQILEIGGEGSSPNGYTPVKIRYTQSWPSATFTVPDTMENVMTDLWVKKEGRWYHLIQHVTGDIN